jgi:hypothetical protein
MVFMTVGDAVRPSRGIHTFFRDVSGETEARIASRHVEAGSRIYTNSFPSYSILQNMRYSHETVC